MRMPEGPAPEVEFRWRAGEFAASLAGRSAHTRAAYEHDVAEFVAWAERGGCTDAARARPPDAAPLPRLPRHPRLRPVVDLPQGRRAARPTSGSSSATA